MTSLSQLRAQAVSHTFFRETTLAEAIQRLGFVQADPIRAPARAQDLILRQRARGYRVGDLERAYPDLDLEEDMLYAYGFLPRDVACWLHPRKRPAMTTLEARVLATVEEQQPVHASDLDEHFGRKRVRNAWGGFSRATKRALEALHRRGRVRVAGRRNGVRVYEIAAPVSTLSAEDRLQRLAKVVARVFAPAQKRTVCSVLARLGNKLVGRGAGRRAVDELIQAGEWVQETTDGVVYVCPADLPKARKAPARVRILAPFDPLVHDRERFEHLWGWPYRFEAYTPIAKRVRGYYAMPLLWRDRVLGWANVSFEDERLHADLGFVRARPRDAAFRKALDLELSRMETFLKGRGVHRGGVG